MTALALTALPVGSPAAPAGGGNARCSAGGGDKGCRAGKRERLRKQRRQNAHQKRPNVIVIDTDDQNQDDMQVLPATIALLGGHGTTFRNSYVSDPLCCPSRATFLTGQYAHNHGVISTDLPNGYNGLDHTNTLAVWLKRAKYRTGMVGKYLNGYGRNDGIPEPLPDARERPPGWSQWIALTGGTEQRRYKFKLNENGKVHKYGRGPRNYVSDVLAKQSYRLIHNWAPTPKPFFLYFNPNAPHGESGTPISSTRDPEPAPRHLGRFGDIQAPRTPNFDETDVSDKPSLIADEPHLSPEVIADIDRRYRGRLESLLAVDEEVRQIVRLLKKTKDLGRTYIIFTSDNGLQLGAHRVEFKSYLYEESTRVPLIIRGPRFPEGAVRDQLVSNIDLAPTIVELTGAVPGRNMDGISLVPLANDPSVAANRDLLFESYDFGLFGIRRGPWSYNEYNNGDTELYDLKTDPYELQSLSSSPTTLTLRQQLSGRLAQLKTCAGENCR